MENFRIIFFLILGIGVFLAGWLLAFKYLLKIKRGTGIMLANLLVLAAYCLYWWSALEKAGGLEGAAIIILWIIVLLGHAILLGIVSLVIKNKNKNRSSIS